ncbi:MAG: hypothetical protein V1732_06050, partial [Patescibacteria group bacterium]
RDITRFEGWVARGNINACLVSLAMLAEKIVWADELKKGRDAILANYNKSFIETRLDRMGDALTGQLRTLIKKLILIMNFASARGEVKEACELVRISRKTFYNWKNMDPAFRNLLREEMTTESGHEFSSLGTSAWGNIGKDSKDSDTLGIAEITHEIP